MSRVGEIQFDETSSNQSNAAKVQSTKKAALFKLLKSTIGSGVLSLPYAFQVSGILGGVALLIVIGVLNFISWLAMIKVMSRENLLESHEVVELPKYIEKHYGDHYLFGLCLSSTILITFGSCVSYLILFNSVIELTFHIFDEIYMQVSLWAIFFIIINIAAFNKSIEKLNIFTVTATVLSFLVIGFVIGYSVDLEQHRGEQDVSLLKIERLPIALGLVLFSYDVNGIITEIRAEMREPEKFPWVLGGSMAIVATMYIIVGTVGYMAFGSETGQIITDDIFNVVQNEGVKIFFSTLMYVYACTLFINLLLLNIPGLSCLRMMCKIYLKFDENSTTQFVLLNVLYIFLETLIPFIFPKFSTVLSLLGCVCSVVLGFLIPFVLYKDAFWSKISKVEKIMRSLLLSFGVIGGILGIVVNFLPE